MTPASSRAYFTSTFLHALVVVLALLYAFFGRSDPEVKPHVFELVAGEGNNYMATEAPAATAPELTVTMPAVPTPPPPRPAPPEPVVEPVIEPAPPVKIEPAPRPSPVQPAPRPVEQKKAPPPTPKRETQAERIRRQLEEKNAKVTVDEFRRQNPTATTPAPTQKAPPRPIRTEKIDVGSITKGATGGTSQVRVGAGGTALTTAEIDQLDRYGAMISQAIRRALESAGLNDLLQVEVQFHVAAGGAISGARIIRGSGSAEFDRAVLDAFRTVQGIGSTPTGRAEDFRVPIRIRER